MNIRQGDQYHIPIRISLNGEDVKIGYKTLEPRILTSKGVSGLGLIFHPLSTKRISSAVVSLSNGGTVSSIEASIVGKTGNPAEDVIFAKRVFEQPVSSGEELLDSEWIKSYESGVSGADKNRIQIIVRGEFEIPASITGTTLTITEQEYIDGQPDYVGVKVGDFLATWPKTVVCECDHDDPNHNHRPHPHPDIPELLFDEVSGRWLFPLKQYMSLGMSSVTNVQVQIGIGDNYITSEIQTVDVERSVIQPKPLPCSDDSRHHCPTLYGGC